MIHILGAGIAGLMLAEALERRAAPWRLYEKAAAAGEEASGKNAGIVRTYETDPVIRDLARRTLEYYRAHEPSFTERGMLLRAWDIDYAEKTEAPRHFSHGRFAAPFLPLNGTIEPGTLLSRLTRGPYRHGSISFGAEVRVHFENQGVAGLHVSGSDRPFLQGDILIVCGGEGSVKIAEAAGRPLALIAHRRTLFEFKNTLSPEGPVEWDEESGVYFRRSAGGATLTATAGEQIPAGDAVVEGLEDEKALGVLASEFPFLTRDKLVSQRTCKRLTALDNRPYAGKDPLVDNLFWFTGLGGRGISIAPALASQLADAICGKQSTALGPFSPARMRA